MYKNKQARLRVKVRYEDITRVMYEAIGFVTINYIYEIELVELTEVQAWDENDELIKAPLRKDIQNQLETLASLSAMEKITPEDFAKESERV